jgi:hypothetical protein
MIQVLLILILIGVMLYLVHTLIPMDPRIRTILDVVVIIIVVLWLLQLFGVMALDMPVPRVR